MTLTNVSKGAWLDFSASWRSKGGERLELWLPRNWPAEDSELREGQRLNDFRGRGAADRSPRAAAFRFRARGGRSARGGGDAARAHGELAWGARGRRARPDASRAGDLVRAARRSRLDARVRRRDRKSVV